MTPAEPRRETPLERRIKEIIAREGPMPVSAYMALCLHDAEHGYYRRQPAIGATGDFVTAPEISQVFGELIGLWCAVVWQQMGAPARVNLVELGPGRGTMMRDMLRAARIVPAFRAALSVHLIDPSETLRAIQQAALADCGVPVHFHTAPSQALTLSPQVPDGPTLVVGNEFLDTLPVAQFIFHDGQWRARRVALDAAQALTFRADPDAAVPPPEISDTRAPHEGSLYERAAGHPLLADGMLRARAAAGPLAALFIDYGHTRTGFGDTLQGVADQKHVSPFHAPGEADLSAQVDFQSFAGACRNAGLAVDGPVPQAEFLGRLGIVERASRLMAANAAQAATIEMQVQRLMAPSGMGSRFLALGVRSPELAPLPALA